MSSRVLAACACTCWLVIGACGNDADEAVAQQTRAQVLPAEASCSFGPAVAIAGQRKLALIVGVGAYQNDKVPDLEGPPNDARHLYDLVTGENGYSIPAANVCLLLNEQATTARFKEAFERGLVERAQAGDVALVFFAGHGSQAKDRNGDEPDQWDETLLFHDARVGSQRDLLDDELNRMLARLHEKTSNVVLILDSCNSGTATRGDSGFTARFFTPDEREELDGDDPSGDGDGAWGGESLPGLVAFTAAGDGTPALETGGQGVFTSALIRVLSAGSTQSLTYAQVARQVAPLVAAKSYQIPYFQGDLQRPVLGGATTRRPLGWDVVVAGSNLQLSGPPLPGMGVGAELYVFDGAVTGTPPPAAAKATLVVTELNGVDAQARVSVRAPDAPPINVGDLATLARPADEYLKVRLGLRGTGDGAIPAARASAIRTAIAAHAEARMLIDVIDGDGGEFELSGGFDGALVLRGPEDAVRNTVKDDAQAPEVLWRHARQRALLQLRGEGGSDFVDNETLRARLIPAARQSLCAQGEWVQAAVNTEQIVPLCYAWNIEVALAEDAPKALLIGVLVLSTDGSTFGLPRDGRTVLLRPGEKTVFNASGETFRGEPPLDTRDQILVFGTQETNPVAWNLLTQTAAFRGVPTERAGTLYRALDRYLKPGTRGTAPLEESGQPTSWTMTTLGMRVEANSRFLKPTAGPLSVSSREWTLKRFDIRPYLPDDPDTALAAVLRTADSLARSSEPDGYGYKQHDWSRASDAENLKVGIDCSRAIWYAFTRSGLRYNRDDKYLSTSMMVGDQSWMADEFEQCPTDEDFALGDVLVYRSNDPQRGDGHVVMVVDAKKRIAWGSHGWDGEGRTPGVEPDTGVEYQLIKYKPDWLRWDRADMSLRTCWRYREFAADARTGRGLPGAAAIDASCESGVCRP